MAKIGHKEIKLLFETSEKFDNDKLTLKEAISFLEANNINRNSAVDYIYNYSNLVNGKVFTRTMNVPSTIYYLDNILRTKGVSALKNALQSLSLHIDYYESVSGSSVKKRKDILNEYLKKYEKDLDNYFEEDLKEKQLTEGSVKHVTVNIYERNAYARQKCIEYHGCACAVCGFNFALNFGDLGLNFIHVHHLKEISEIKKEYIVNYKTDLIPVCPNCHAMLHKRIPAYTVEELKTIILENKH